MGHMVGHNSDLFCTDEAIIIDPVLETVDRYI